MKGCGLQVARQLRRNRRFLSTSEEPSKNISSFEKARNLFESSAQLIVVAGTIVGGAYYLGAQHVSLIAEVNSLKKEILVEAKVSDEKEQALAKVSAEKEQALKSILAEKEKTQAAEKRELEARIRELESNIKNLKPSN